MSKGKLGSGISRAVISIEDGRERSSGESIEVGGDDVRDWA